MTWLDDLIEYVDLSTNMEKQAGALAIVRYPFSVLYLAIYCFIAAALAALAWRFDFQPTLVFANIAVDRVTDSEMAGWIGAVAAFCITALPTLSELGFLPLLARADVKIARWGMIALVSFDLLTDAPEAFRFVSQGFGPHIEYYAASVAPAVVYAGFVIWVLLSTLAFEFLLMLSLAGIVQLVWVTFRHDGPYSGTKGGGKHEQRARAGATSG